MTEPAPQPALGFSVGIVGHRNNRITDSGQVRERIAEILCAVDAAVGAAAVSGFYPAGRVPLRLVSALAEGADRLAASAAIEAGFELDVVLPFAAGEYRKDFADHASVEEFDALLGQASRVLVLDGQGDERNRAYEAAGVTLLDNSDLLIAVWDGGPGRGRGGTREVIEEATRRAIPVAVVDPSGTEAKVRSGGAGAGPMRLEDVPEVSLAALPELIEAEVGLAEGPEHAEQWLRDSEPPSAPAIHSAYPLLLFLAGVAPRRRRKTASSPEAPAAEPGALQKAFGWWDDVAIHAAQAFRSAVIVNFSLASLAVLLAAVSLLAEDYKWLFVIAEIGTILLLLVNARSANRNRWQERWLESREVAELLRVCALLRSIGVGRGIADPGQGGRLGWYAGAFARSASLEHVDLSEPGAAAAPLIADIRSQADWNRATSKRMHLAAKRIERFGQTLFVLVLAAAVGWLVVDIVDDRLAHRLRFVVTAITAGFPAMATASYGIRVILDFEGVAQRTGRIGTGLDGLLARWAGETPSAARLQEFARDAADIMLGDIAAWRLLTEGRRLTIPG